MSDAVKERSEFERFMTEECSEYILPHETGDGRWVAIAPFLFTYGIISGPMANDEWRTGYDYRWCYASLIEAEIALAHWRAANYVGEPEGWHRRIPEPKEPHE